MARILLVRHGETTWNATGRWQGWADAPLSELGEQQAQDAAMSAVAYAPFDRVVCSDLQRARRTAELLTGALGAAVGTAEVIVDPDLRERDVGEWSGLTRDEIRDRFPGALPQDLSASFDIVPPPGWESDDHMLTRVSRGLLRSVHGLPSDATVLAISHGGVVYLLEKAAGSERGRVANLSGILITVDDVSLVPGPRVDLAPPIERTTPAQL